MCGGKVERQKRNKAACKTCNRTWHADANAALNLYLLGPSKGHGVEATPQRPLALRWNRHRWVGRRESAAKSSRLKESPAFRPGRKSIWPGTRPGPGKRASGKGLSTWAPWLEAGGLHHRLQA
ncbi:transposase [Meiothermus taiwanensis]|uniref:transposase n=1 Tax=Meiothermus taiwanensis TaxID=172827 RepID=UPI001FDF3411|nr:transposase [Meiothermus taiwanensis]